jgi:hypothetical protein
MPVALSRVSLLGSMLLVFTSCGSSSGDQATGDQITRYLAAVRSGDGSVLGQLRSGALPSGNGPSVQASAGGAVLPGGSNLVSISSGTPLTRIVVGVQGADGYYELTGLASAVDQSVLLTLGQSPPGAFSFLFAGGSASALGAATAVPVTLTSVGTGDVQVNVSWDVDSDVDLTCSTPPARRSTTGTSPQPRAESRTWTPTLAAPWITSARRTSPGPPGKRPTAPTVSWWTTGAPVPRRRPSTWSRST